MMIYKLMAALLLLFFNFILPRPETLTSAQERSPFEQKQVILYGQKINYLETGSGPKVILLHGLGDDLGVWEQTIPALRENFHVYALDQLGFGRSDKPAINYRIQVLVEYLKAFCDKAGVDKATLVGNSMGGWVAAAFAQAYPDRVEKLVLVGAAGYWPKQADVAELTREDLNRLALSSPSAYKATLQWMFYDERILTDEFVAEAYRSQLERRDGYTISQFIESIFRREDRLDAKLKQITAPSLALWGAEDEVTPLPIAEAIAKQLPNARKAVIEKCGHMPQFECPRAFNQALLSFLKTGLKAD
jgi:pimeloyl-ACP methyl ester carboxylesterase